MTRTKKGERERSNRINKKEKEKLGKMIIRCRGNDMEEEERKKRGEKNRWRRKRGSRAG